MGESCEECDACNELKIDTVKVEATMEKILERMDRHDELEKTKRKERREDKRDRRREAIAILLSIVGVALTFGIWLNNFTHDSDKRIQKIETTLGIDIQKN